MTDTWQQDDDWEQHSPWVDSDAVESGLEEDVHDGAAYHMQGYAVTPPQSGLGIASLIVSVIAGLMILVPLIVGVVVLAQNPNLPEDDPRILSMGCAMLVGIALAVIAGIMGVIGLFQPDRARTCAVVGIVFAGLEIFGVLGLFLIGLLAA